MVVIADLRGGDLENEIAITEFREIKEVVEQEVIHIIDINFLFHIY